MLILKSQNDLCSMWIRLLTYMFHILRVKQIPFMHTWYKLILPLLNLVEADAIPSLSLNFLNNIMVYWLVGLNMQHASRSQLNGTWPHKNDLKWPIFMFAFYVLEACFPPNVFAIFLHIIIHALIIMYVLLRGEEWRGVLV